MDDVVTVSSGRYTTMAVRTNGTLWAWGANWDGQLGDGTTTDRHTPVKIMDDVVAVSNNIWGSTMAIKTDGSLWGWGWNDDGQLGDGSYWYRQSPVKIMEETIAVSIGANITIAIREDGTIWSWGFNLLNNQNTPTQITG